MISKRDLKILLVGIILGAFILGMVPIYGSPVLQQLYVDYSSVKKIVIDGVERKPADDMKPFIANGRTYVALKYISDAFGKKINFDPKSGTITIGDTDPSYKGSMNMESSDDFTGTLKKWYTNPADNSSLGNWSIDGPNGLVCNGLGWLNYKDIYEIGKSYTQEADVAINCDDDGGSKFAGFSIAADKDSIFCNYVLIGNYRGTGYIKIEKSEDTSKMIKYKNAFESGKYYHLKAVSNTDGNIDIYIDDKYVSSYKNSGVEYCIGFSVNEDLYSFYHDTPSESYFKNYKVTCNEK